MIKKRKIAVITSTRAEYGLFHPILTSINSDQDLELTVLATGAHLQQEHGETYKEIEAHGFNLKYKKSFLTSLTDPLTITQNFGNSSIVAAKFLHETKPDILLVLGDRYEMMAFASAALLMHIPIAHIAGGEITTGAIDDSLRHAITKLSSIHFPATELYAKRIIQMGESPENVHVVGSTGAENAAKIQLKNKENWIRTTGYALHQKNILATFHPVTNEIQSTQEQLKSLFDALDQNPDIGVLFTAPNADENGDLILSEIESYVTQNSNRVKLIKSLGFINYLSALQFFDGVIGNSSSGIIEAPSFKIGTINIGSRQNGRTRAASIIDCAPNADEINKAIKRLYSDEFQETLKTVKNPFEKDDTSHSIKEILKNTDLQNIQIKKFHETF